jgi:ActR/RegA family two-component response regulator
MAGRPKRALVVDDAENWRRYLCLELKYLGCEVVAAASLAEGLAALKTGPFDLAIVDVRLVEWDEKDLSGLIIVREAWKRRQAEHIVVLSGNLTIAQIEAGLGTDVPYVVFDKGDRLQDSLLPDLERLMGIAEAEESTPEERPAAIAPDEQQVSSLRALVVEDAESWADLYRVALERQGFFVQTARAYADAVGLTRREHFDLAVADLELAPGCEARCDAGPQNLYGIFLIEWFLDRQVPFLIVTGHARPGVVDPIYREFPVFQIMDKASFSLDSFEEYVKEARSRPKQENAVLPSDQARRRQMFEALVREALTACADAPGATGELQQMARNHRLDMEMNNLLRNLGLNQPVPPAASVAAVRELLRESFSDRDLRWLCQDNTDLRPIIDRMPGTMSLLDMAREVTDYCEKQQLWHELLAAVAKANPRRVKRFADRMGQDPGQTTRPTIART